MNRENVQRTIDYLRAPLPVGFDMCMWVEDHDAECIWGNPRELPDTFNCNTTACIAGHIVIAFRDEMDLSVQRTICQAATEFLGLNAMQSIHLFYGHFRDPNVTPHLCDVTLDQAIAELERMLSHEA